MNTTERLEIVRQKNGYYIPMMPASLQAYVKEYLAPLRGQFASFYKRRINLASRSNNPYATHVPVLTGIALLFEPKHLIEFGSGVFSTLAFSDALAFPSIETVNSYEDNEEWYKHIEKQLPSNGRAKLHLVEGAMYKAVAAADTSHADMIFIDDSPIDKKRVPTVLEVAKSCGSKPIVVMHDYDLWRLRLAALRFEHRVCFNALNPQCCVMWNSHPERKSIIEGLNSFVNEFEGSLETTDALGWRTKLLEAFSTSGVSA